jgi:hypothetical protein
MADLKIKPMGYYYRTDIDLSGLEVPPKLLMRVIIKLGERLIGGLIILLAVAAGLMPLATMARVGLVTFVVCVAIILTLGKSIGTGDPFEFMIWGGGDIVGLPISKNRNRKNIYGFIPYK